MALFGKKQSEKKVEKATPAAATSQKPQAHMSSDLSHILKSPRITEKATMHQEAGVYTFDVAPNATKRLVSQAVSALYNVVPKKVRIVTIATKQTRSARTGTRGVTRGGKKAYVYLKSGETITIA